MPYRPAVAVDARHLRLVDLPTHRCPLCWSPVHVDLIEVTSFSDIAAVHRTFLWGRWARCRCGSTGVPVDVIGADFLCRGVIGRWLW